MWVDCRGAGGQRARERDGGGREEKREQGRIVRFNPLYRPCFDRPQKCGLGECCGPHQSLQASLVLSSQSFCFFRQTSRICAGEAARIARVYQERGPHRAEATMHAFKGLDLRPLRLDSRIDHRI